MRYGMLTEPDVVEEVNPALVAAATLLWIQSEL
jgi:hypothetical protein